MTITVSKTFATEAEAAAWLSGTAPSTDTSAATTTKATTTKATKPPAEKAKPQRSREDMVGALQELRTAKGKEAAKAVIESTGGCEKMAEIPDDKIEAVYEAAKAAMTAPDDDGM